MNDDANYIKGIADKGSIFPELMDALSHITLGLSGVLSTGLKYALFQCSQKSQYTADRGGLLACQDTYAVKKLFAKLAGLPEKNWAEYDVDELSTQAREFEGFTENTFDRFMRFLYGNNLWAVARDREVIEWIDSGEYNRVLVKRTPKMTISD